MEENKKSLKSLFEQNKISLANQLESLSLPRDTQKVKEIVSNHLNGLLDSAGEYRQTLTQSEEFILLSVMNLLQAQQSMIGAICVENYSKKYSSPKEQANPNKGSISKEKAPIVVGGTAIGGVAGALMLHTWGALFGAIAGTAIVLYIAANQEPNPRISTTSTPTRTKPSGKMMDVDSFLSIVGNIWKKVEDISDTDRVQGKRIRNTCEQKEKPTLQSDYGMLLDQIANVCKVCESNKDSVPAKMQNAIGLLEESLENYGLNYNNGKIISI